MKKLHSLLFHIFLILLVSLFPSITFGQPIDPGCVPVEGCPIDGGVSLLIVFAIGVGAKKSYNERKKS